MCELCNVWLQHFVQGGFVIWDDDMQQYRRDNFNLVVFVRMEVYCDWFDELSFNWNLDSRNQFGVARLLFRWFQTSCNDPF